MKALHREVVLSATYRQSAQTPSEAMTSDEANKLLSHYPVQRLSAEQYRDALLTLAGSLAIELPGGRIIVAYYADRITQHQRYHMGAINLSIGELR